MNNYISVQPGGIDFGSVVMVNTPNRVFRNAVDFGVFSDFLIEVTISKISPTEYIRGLAPVANLNFIIFVFIFLFIQTYKNKFK